MNGSATGTTGAGTPGLTDDEKKKIHHWDRSMTNLENYQKALFMAYDEYNKDPDNTDAQKKVEEAEEAFDAEYNEIIDKVNRLSTGGDNPMTQLMELINKQLTLRQNGIKLALVDILTSKKAWNMRKQVWNKQYREGTSFIADTMKNADQGLPGAVARGAGRAAGAGTMVAGRVAGYSTMAGGRGAQVAGETINKVGDAAERMANQMLYSYNPIKMALGLVGRVVSSVMHTTGAVVKYTGVGVSATGAGVAKVTDKIAGVSGATVTPTCSGLSEWFRKEVDMRWGYKPWEGSTKKKSEDQETQRYSRV